MPRRAVPNYEAFHWGHAGEWASKRLWVPDPKAGPITIIGALVDVTYRTTKGRDHAEWNHRFEKHLPLLAYNTEGLIVVGGNYQISTRGIVG